MLDIRCALTEGETRLLQRVAMDRVVYEAGALLGGSTVRLAQVAKRVVSCDPHDGYPVHQPRPTWLRFKDNLRRYGLDARVVAHRSRFEQVALPLDCSLAWADLTGEYGLTARFLVHAQAARFIAVHDYGRNHCDGATEAVDRWIKASKPRWVERTDSLIVLERR